MRRGPAKSARARLREHSVNEGDARGAVNAAPRTDPLRLVEAAVSGDDLPRVVAATAESIELPVAISLPALGVWATSTEALPDGAADAVAAFASDLIGDPEASCPEWIVALAPVRLAGDTVGVVVAFDAPNADAADGESTASTAHGQGQAQSARPWLEAAAAAAAVTALMRDSSDETAQSARRAFLQLLLINSAASLESVLQGAGRLGYDFTAGAIAVCAARASPEPLDFIPYSALGVVADIGDGRITGLIPLSGESAQRDADQMLELLRDDGAIAVASAPRRGAVGVGEALREAGVLLELALETTAAFVSQEETYRLLVGVLVRDASELNALQERTIAAVERYDSSHDTELMSTLETFLAHHGSTTDTAEAMALHRHTVGYRLARVQEVSGLSPYESEGRERLGLGLKAHRIILADQRRSQRIGRQPGR